MRSRTICCSAIVICLLTSVHAGAWGIPSIPGRAALPVSTSASADPDAFLVKAKNAERLVDRSSDHLFNAVASKEEQEKMEAMKKKLNETTDDKEKNALRQQITESEMATIEKRSKDKELLDKAEQMDSKKKQQIANGFYNLSLGSLQTAALVPEGTSIANSITNNPANAVRLGLKAKSVYDSVKTLGGLGSNITKVLSAIRPLMSAAKIETKAPSSASDTPKEIDGGI
jgi:hypothetical protein